MNRTLQHLADKYMLITEAQVWAQIELKHAIIKEQNEININKKLFDL